MFRRVLTLIAALMLLASPVDAGGAGRLRLARSISWLAPGATSGFDYANNRYFSAGIDQSFGALFTFSRASIGWAPAVSGCYSQFASGSPRLTDKGLLMEGARTNIVLRNRDLTNAAWVKTNMTAALDQTGFMCDATSASKITATADNATICQAITDASKNRFMSFFIKRITGTGAVSAAMDGSTYTVVSATGSLARVVSMATQAFANPSVCFKLATNGDAVEIDAVQVENGAFPSSPIVTTTVSVPRSTDSLQVTSATIAPLAGGTFYAAYNSITATNTSAEIINNRVDAANKEGIEEYTTNKMQFFDFVANTFIAQNVSDNVISNTASYKTAVSYVDGGPYVTAFSTNLATDVVTTASGATPVGSNTLWIGNNNSGQQCYCEIEAVYFSSVPQSAGTILNWAQN